MAIKTVVRIYCERCGQQDAVIKRDSIWRGLHNCPKAPPGPGSYPQQFSLNNVIVCTDREVA